MVVLVLGIELVGSPICFRNPSSWQHRKCQNRKPSNLSLETNFVVLLFTLDATLTLFYMGGGKNLPPWSITAQQSSLDAAN